MLLKYHMHTGKKDRNLKFGSAAFCVEVLVLHQLLMCIVHGEEQAEKQMCMCHFEIVFRCVKHASPSGQVRLGY